jgi:hypothetical protein
MDDVGIAVLYPELLGTYGDGGNARILAQRLIWRGIPASVVTVAMGDPVPRTCSIYTLGGGEDAPQALASAALITDGGLTAAVDAGAVVLAVCAGLQVIGTRFRAGDEVQAGVGLVDADSSRPLRTRAVGELVIDPDPELGLPGLMSGYENHASITTLGPGVMPLGRVMSGVGNGSRVDGYWAGKVVGTYLHGPVLARNPDMADLLLGWAVGDLPALNRPDVDADAAGLREERLASALGRRRARHHFGT